MKENLSINHTTCHPSINTTKPKHLNTKTPIKNYKMAKHNLKNIVRGVALGTLIPLAVAGSNAYADSKINANYNAPKQTIESRASSNDLYNGGFQVASNLTKTSTAQSGVKPYVEVNENHSSVGFAYTSNNFKEFFWGLSRPFHLYNTDPRTKKKEILPFYLHPLKEGGILSWLNPRAWKRNTSLTAGTLSIEIIAAVATSYGGSSGGGSSGGGGGASAGGGSSGPTHGGD